ncbi:MAG TPA: biotin--[acetyl-CoA-carboxylase] ligase [Thermoplasmata archaeon]|nr:biotin--[acetyl-CoA-carboxylase] ligase [Thermoplasmata archaeon]
MTERLVYDVLPSTQSRAVELVRAGAGTETYVVARSQSEGRGRGEHRWSSPPGGLYLSWIGPDLSASGPSVSLALAASLHQLLGEQWGVPSELKWPNDLVCPGPSGRVRKIAGLLPERIVGPRGARSVVGIGLNVVTPRVDFPPELRDHVAEISDYHQPPPPLEEVEATVVRWLGRTLPELATSDGISRWLAVGRAILYGRGREARVDGVPAGRIVGLHADGALWLDGPQGPSIVRSGELFIEEPT